MSSTYREPDKDGQLVIEDGKFVVAYTLKGKNKSKPIPDDAREFNPEDAKEGDPIRFSMNSKGEVVAAYIPEKDRSKGKGYVPDRRPPPGADRVQHRRGGGGAPRQVQRDPTGPPVYGATAPYNFITWLDSEQAKELPDEGAKTKFSGRLQLKMEALTPLLVAAAGGQDDEDDSPGAEKPLRETRALGDGDDKRHAIPGASLKGMFRSVFEIVTASPPPTLNTNQLPYRELRTETRYHRLTVQEVPAKHYKPKARAGFLVFKGKQAVIVPCNYSRVFHGDIKAALPKFQMPKHGESPMSVYRKLESVKLTCRVEKEKSHPMGKKGGGMHQVYSKAVPANDGTQGWLVCSGPMASKKSESFFHGVKEGVELAVARDVAKDFDDMLSRDQRKFYKYLKKNAKKLGFWEGAIPIYYLTEEGNDEQVKHIGLAMLFRVPALKSPAKVWQARFDGFPNAASAVFGTTKKAGHIFFSHASSSNAKSDTDGHYILGQPHPTCTAHYLFPDPLDEWNTKGKHHANVLLGWNSDEPAVRGWKRYWHRPHAKPVPLNLTNSDDQKKLNVASHLKPLKPGAVFTTSIEFRDLSAVELGALLYAINPGEDANAAAYHKLGMGKALGWGSVKVDVDVTRFEAWEPAQRYHSILARFNTEPQQAITVEDARKAFEDRLRQLFPAGTPHIDDLRKMMDFEHAKKLEDDWTQRTRPLELQKRTGRLDKRDRELLENEFKPKALLSSVEAVYKGTTGA